VALRGEILQYNEFHGADKNSIIFFLYLTENTVVFHYKDQSVHVTSGNNRYLFWETNETHKNDVFCKVQSFEMLILNNVLITFTVYPIILYLTVCLYSSPCIIFPLIPTDQISSLILKQTTFEETSLMSIIH